MAYFSEEQLLSVIEKDDLKAFNALMEKARCGSYRLGRFPVLSLLYLCASRKILAAYEVQFLKITSWTELSEPARLTRRFSKVAGKCLRLYFNETVSPLEMLIMLDKGKHAQKVYPKTKLSEAVKERMQLIYAIKYALALKFEGNELLIARRPLTRGERKKLSVLAIGCAAALAVMITVPVTFGVLFGQRNGGDVTMMSQINLAKDTTYTLQSDITVSKRYAGKEVNCKIIGNGHKITFKKNATLGEFSGGIKDATIVTAGSPVFTYFMPNAELTGVTVNVNAGVTENGHSAMLVLANYGTLDGVTVNVSGNLSATAKGMSGNTDELIFGGLALENVYYSKGIYGTIKNCTVNYSDFSLSGELSANATFGGIVGINNGVVENCTVTGEITADTFDLAGACYVNYATLSRVVNEAKLQQVARTEEWSPVVGGIVIENAFVTEYCKNAGDIAVEGDGIAICGGIAARTYGQTNYCISSGDIEVSAQSAYMGNIFGRSEVKFLDKMYCGFADNCIGSGKLIAALQEEESCIGGIGGFIQEGVTTNYLRNEKGEIVQDEDGNPIVESVEYVGGGGIRNCFFLGEIESGVSYFGSIVGVCGEDIYERNSYTSGSNKYANFEGNYYVDRGVPSFGAVVSTEGEFRQVPGKGAQEVTEDELKDKETYQEILEKLGI